MVNEFISINVWDVEKRDYYMQLVEKLGINYLPPGSLFGCNFSENEILLKFKNGLLLYIDYPEDAKYNVTEMRSKNHPDFKRCGAKIPVLYYKAYPEEFLINMIISYNKIEKLYWY